MNDRFPDASCVSVSMQADSPSPPSFTTMRSHPADVASAPPAYTPRPLKNLFTANGCWADLLE
ncbi:hypothetical protein, partial [Pseudomonas savastanoi]|uniref:hypothetical protein n=1 Tax=Pseudomonas savastanoi TaxID=29438 RepID=UPI001F43BAC9